MTTRSTPAFLPFRAVSSQVSQELAPQSRPTRICPWGPTPPGLPGTSGFGTGGPVPWQIFLFQLAVSHSRLPQSRFHSLPQAWSLAAGPLGRQALQLGSPQVTPGG